MPGLTDYQRGFLEGSLSLTKWLYDEFRSKRKGSIPTMDIYRFDSLVEKHLAAVGLPKDPEADGDAVPSDDQASGDFA